MSYQRDRPTRRQSAKHLVQKHNRFFGGVTPCKERSIPQLNPRSTESFKLMGHSSSAPSSRGTYFGSLPLVVAAVAQVACWLAQPAGSALEEVQGQ